MVMFRALCALCVLRTLADQCPPPSPESWMEEMWPWIRDRKIVDLTLPGSHNSGAVKSMSHQGRCGAIYGDFKSQIKAAAGPFLEALVTDNMLQTYYQPWNVNQHLAIYEQMRSEGIRFFHLKFCNFVMENDKNGPFDLNHLYHSHGGYTSMSVASIFADIIQFLVEHPLEIAVVGLNDYWEVDNQTGLAESVGRHLGSANVSLVRAQDWSNSVGDLVAENRRLVVFAPKSQTEGILPSEQYFIENWDHDEMGSDNFDRATQYLINDAITHALTPRDKFYALQAHPAKNTDALTPDKIFGQSADPMLDFMMGWLNDSRYFPNFVESLLENHSSMVLNAITTDFVELSGNFELAMRVQSFCNTTTTTQTISTTFTSTSTVTTGTAGDGLSSGATSTPPYSLSGCVSLIMPAWPLLTLIGLSSS